MAKKLTAEDLEMIDGRTKQRLDGMDNDGWELEDIMDLRDHITALEQVGPCTWEYDDDDDYWGTSCGDAFCITDGTPAENKMHYCPYCGKKLVEKEKEHADA